MAQALKLVFISVNGTQWRIKGDGATIDIGGFMREPVNGVNSFDHTKEPKEATIECEVIVVAGTRLDDYDLDGDAKVVAQADTGQQYIINNAYTTEPPVIDGGTIKRTIKGPPAEKDE